MLVPQSFFRMSVLFAAALSACAMQPRGDAQVQAPPSNTQVQSRAQVQAPRAIVWVSVTCTANPVSVFTGGTVTVSGEGEGRAGATAGYSAFTTDAGRLAVTGAAGRLNTAGLSARTAHVTCTAIDSAGRNASQVVEVKVLSAPHTEQLHIPQSGVSGAVIKPQPVPPPPPVIIRGGQATAKDGPAATATAKRRVSPRFGFAVASSSPAFSCTCTCTRSNSNPSSGYGFAGRGKGGPGSCSPACSCTRHNSARCSRRVQTVKGRGGLGKPPAERQDRVSGPLADADAAGFHRHRGDSRL